MGEDGEDDGCEAGGGDGLGTGEGTTSGVEETTRGFPCSSTVISCTAGSGTGFELLINVRLKIRRRFQIKRCN